MNRRTLVLAGLAALPASMLAMPGIAAPKRRPRRKPRAAKPKPAWKVVTRTFANAQTISIPAVGAALPYPTAIPVSGLTQGKIQKVTLALYGLTHTYPLDVDIMLVAPNGRTALVMSDVGEGTDVTGLTLVLDDQAAAPLPTPLVSGTFRPTNLTQYPDILPPTGPSIAGVGSALAVFHGGNPNGLWQLYVSDQYGNDAGSISGGWSLTIRAKIKVVRKSRRKLKASGNKRSQRRPAK